MMTKFCFVDMDGVLADFVGGILRAYDKPNPYTPDEMGLWNLGDYWGMTNDEMMSVTHQPGFWENLEIIPGSQKMMEELYSIFGVDNVCILSSPAMNSSNCIPEKVNWLEKYFSELTKRKNHFFGSRKGFMGGVGNWLIDDADFNVADFRKSGGSAVLFPQPWNSDFKLYYEILEYYTLWDYVSETLTFKIPYAEP
jgi:5'(3')-deoxyribonucleotidase